MSAIDIFDLRDVAQELGLRNRVVAPDNEPLETASVQYWTDRVMLADYGVAHDPASCQWCQRYAAAISGQPPACSKCSGKLTIVDRGMICRQCRLDYAGQDA